MRHDHEACGQSTGRCPDRLRALGLSVMFSRPAGAPGGLGIATTLAQHVSRWLRSGLRQQAEHIS